MWKNWIVLLCLLCSYFHIHQCTYCKLKGIVSVSALNGIMMKRNCTYLDGSLQIIFEELPDNPESTKAFKQLLQRLDHLEVITGFLYVDIRVNSSVTFSMRQLKAILGRETPRKKKCKTSSLCFSDTDENLKGFYFPNLKIIAKGDVGFFGNSMCRPEVTVNWTLLFRPKSNQTVLTKDNLPQDCLSSSPECHSSCPLLGTKSFCSGPNPAECQTSNLCTKRNCDFCFLKDKEEECCNDLCMGGCTDSSPNTCTFCTTYIYQGRCLHTCPDGTFVMDKLCYDQCPDTYFVFDGACVQNCPSGYVQRNGRCESSDQTGASCVMLDQNQNHLTLTKRILATLHNCTNLIGSVVLTIESFNGADPISTLAEMDNLSNLTSIDGVLVLNFDGAPAEFQSLKSLHFLRNLQAIHGNNVGTTRFESLGILNTQLEWLEMKSLKSVKGVAVFKNNPKLRYSKTVQWTALGASKVLDDFPEELKGKCDVECNVTLGCVGPNSSQCLGCQNWHLADICVNRCEQQSDYFTPTVGTAEDLNRSCSACHPQCNRCSGPGPHQCERCRNKRNGTVCLAECPNNTFLDSIGVNCLPCSDVCLIESQSNAICRGPRDTDCLKCHAVILDQSRSRVLRCVRSRPEAYYLNSMSVSNAYSPVVQPYYDGKHPLEVYEPCDHLCGSCDDKSCFFCNGNWQNERCVRKCNAAEMPRRLKNETYAINATCPSCHPECLECTGLADTECLQCRQARVNITGSTNFRCVSECPDNYRLDVATKMCLSEDESQKRLLLIVGCSILLVAILGAIVVISCIINYCFKRKALEKEKKIQATLNSYFSNGFENNTQMYDTLSSRAPNLNRLEIINADELLFEQVDGQRLGSGAFGDVFRAQWTFSDTQLMRRDARSLDLAGERTTHVSVFSGIKPSTLYKLDVAVKLLSRFNSQSQEQMQELFDEAKVMASVKHPHCLPLIGLCLSEHRQCLVTAFMPLGSMDRYLHLRSTSLTADTLLLWAKQIADGMLYLTLQGIIHRDLATRNVLLRSEQCAVITDFGLSKILDNDSQHEVVIRAGRVPIRWLAVETLTHGIYSHKTDVWSFGVTVWEIFTLGEVPYKELETLTVGRYVLDGFRLSQPNGCHLMLYKEMLRCWADDPNSRPDFKALCMKFDGFCQNPEEYYTPQTPLQLLESPIMRSKRGRHRSVKKTPGQTIVDNNAEPLSRVVGGTTYVDMSSALTDDLPELTEPLMSGSNHVTQASDNDYLSNPTTGYTQVVSMATDSSYLPLT